MRLLERLQAFVCFFDFLYGVLANAFSVGIANSSNTRDLSKLTDFAVFVMHSLEVDIALITTLSLGATAADYALQTLAARYLIYSLEIVLQIISSYCYSCQLLSIWSQPSAVRV